MTRYLAVSNFDKHQHYKKNTRPSWIKYYVKLLDPHHPLNELPVTTRYVFDRMLLLAATHNNAVPNDSELIAKLLRMPPGDCREALDQLLKGRWIKEKQTTRTSRGTSRGNVSLEVEKKDLTRANKQPPRTTGHTCPECGTRQPSAQALTSHLVLVHDHDPPEWAAA